MNKICLRELFNGSHKTKGLLFMINKNSLKMFFKKILPSVVLIVLFVRYFDENVVK